MKRLYSAVLLTVLFLPCTYSYDFKVANANGVELAYTKLADSVSVAFTYDTPSYPNRNGFNYNSMNSVDTLQIPNSVEYNGRYYLVSSLYARSCSFMSPNIKSISIPASVQNIEYVVDKDIRAGRATFYNNQVEDISVNEDNSFFCSIDGLLYTKDKKTLIAYPTARVQDSIYLPEGIESIAGSALSSQSQVGLCNTRYIELPLSLRKISQYAIEVDSMQHIVVKDNVDTLTYLAIYSVNLTHVTLGKGVKEVGSSFIDSDAEAPVDVYCRATIPPTWNNEYNNTFLPRAILQNGHLYVPQKSMALYRQAEGWSQFQHILPIEPPIVTESNSATISWVQNFSATGYQWHLYSDEEHMQLVMTLTFDERGYLTNIILGDIAAAPNNRHMMNNTEDNDDTERRFAEYYSFTISSLNPATQYYFVRQSFHGDEVIDEEQGTFNTLPATPTNLEQANDEDTSRPTKSLHGGQVLIHRDGTDYDLKGRKMELRE